ncbi:hypothetical protein IFM89_008585 [Coptis chinensis]|uniref:RRM domain-containing protein n=1 Tax=Coptis chinensis TaxID=261450 RepID=A0A835HWL5_9MAGN|nr:hypothetical protein IFM89_008585 [Coptis chinensis]
MSQVRAEEFDYMTDDEEDMGGNVVGVATDEEYYYGSDGEVLFDDYESASIAKSAMEILNFTPLNGKPIRIMLSHRDPSIRKSGHANVFIKNLDPEIDNKNLHDSFSTFGKVLSCNVATDLNGHSKGYGYVQFEQEEAAQNVIKGLDGMLMNDIEISVGLFVRKQERHRADGSEKDTNLYVKNFSETLTDEDLKKIFSAYGTITHAYVMKDVKSGKSKGFGFVKFEKSDNAAFAIEKMNGYSHNDKVWYVGLAKSKTERKAELKSKFEQESSGKVDKLQGANLYLKNLDDDFSDEKLKELFSQFGTITSHTIKRDMQGQSMGYGFVAFSTPEDVAKVADQSGTVVKVLLEDGKPVSVDTGLKFISVNPFVGSPARGLRNNLQKAKAAKNGNRTLEVHLKMFVVNMESVEVKMVFSEPEGTNLHNIDDDENIDEEKLDSVEEKVECESMPIEIVESNRLETARVVSRSGESDEDISVEEPLDCSAKEQGLELEIDSSPVDNTQLELESTDSIYRSSDDNGDLSGRSDVTDEEAKEDGDRSYVFVDGGILLMGLFRIFWDCFFGVFSVM